MEIESIDDQFLESNQWDNIHRFTASALMMVLKKNQINME